MERQNCSDVDVESLTGREMQILDLLTENLSSKEIAQRLSLSGRTIDNHCVKIVRKLGARDRYDAVRRWQRLGGFN